jgi:hypothetical protein
MIAPEDIRRTAVNLYPAFLAAWLDGESFFPKTVRGRRTPEGDLASASAAVGRLREGSKAALGYGYTVEWVEVNSRTYGRNLFPGRIVFETHADFLRYLGKEEEFAAFADAVGRIRSSYPELESWMRANRALTIEAAASIDGLLQVAGYLRAHPRPGLFVRELPLPLDTKFVERHRRVLREWLDRILPPDTIRADEEHFERRFGLRYAEPHVMLRFLDPAVQEASGCRWPELSLPLHTLARLPVAASHAVVVENKVNLLTLPPIGGAVALGGLGNGATDLRYLPWLASRAVWYWGDLDVEGFAILSRLRAVLPHTRSLMMNEETLTCWRDRLAMPGTGRGGALPAGLTPGEAAAFRTCVEQDLRIEQERLPQAFVMEALRAEGLNQVAPE